MISMRSIQQTHADGLKVHGKRRIWRGLQVQPFLKDCLSKSKLRYVYTQKGLTHWFLRENFYPNITKTNTECKPAFLTWMWLTLEITHEIWLSVVLLSS